MYIYIVQKFRSVIQKTLTLGMVHMCTHTYVCIHLVVALQGMPVVPHNSTALGFRLQTACSCEVITS